MHTINAPLAAAVVSVDVSQGQTVSEGQLIATLESMKMQTAILAPTAGIISALTVALGETVQAGQRLATLTAGAGQETLAQTPAEILDTVDVNAKSPLAHIYQQHSNTLDHHRQEAVAKRHSKGYRSARENLQDLCDENSFVEYGQLAVAAQRGRKSLDALRSETAADGVITGLATINHSLFGPVASQVAVVINDYTVLAGTQGYFHHKKIDRILEQAKRHSLPVIMYTEGGGGRPGDTDVKTQIAGLDVSSFARWAALSGQVPLIAVNNGYCFAGNAALFGCADIRIATQQSWIGMAGPAMIEGGGLGSYKPTDIGPIDVQAKNGVVSLVADNEAQATALAKQVLGYFQGDHRQWQCAQQADLRDLMPADRRYVYDIRKIIQHLADSDSWLELSKQYGRAIATGFVRIEGKAMGLIANDCRVLGGAIDAEAADKAARFITLCNNFSIPLLSLCDTPGFMVGPDSEEQGAATRMAQLFIAGAKLTTPLVTIFLRKGYGLGAMAMAGGSFHQPIYSAAWPMGEFGGMGLEGAVRLGFKKELAAEKDQQAKDALFSKLLAEMYQRGQASEAAAHLEIDAVIDPADTRSVVIRALNTAIS
ncbi:MAG: biotin/lipoyl-binding protein [Alphaproteobacteria bacterium]|nr:biotin/lipoyl-binding protein [Alphaproteobacteria bacterium]MDP4752582.1 biotin/lipoyl-binding protein [Porticoccaceae bacterium]MDP4988278.1 biotin/lipoyl-binding protein [Porticoccaceae bacterium]